MKTNRSKALYLTAVFAGFAVNAHAALPAAYALASIATELAGYVAIAGGAGLAVFAAMRVPGLIASAFKKLLH